MADTTTSPARSAAPRGNRWPFVLPLVVLLVLGGIFAKRLLDVENGVDPSVIPTVLLNTPMPSFDLAALPGRGEALKSDDLKGQVFLLNFWGSWCVTCAYEHGMLLDIAASGDVPIHGVAWRDDPALSLKWLAQRGDPYAKVGQDPQSKTAIAFGVVAAPETFLIDKQGIIRYKQAGPITPEDWHNKIQPLIAQLKK
jgi:cytochrome c biogenesis protein CcmG, thiol:disulfide interchange protein DsbE